MTNPNEKDIEIGGVKFLAIKPDIFAVPGGGIIKGRQNAINAAHELIDSHNTLRNSHKREMRNG